MWLFSSMHKKTYHPENSARSWGVKAAGIRGWREEINTVSGQSKNQGPLSPAARYKNKKNCIKVEPLRKLETNLWPEILFVIIDFETCCLFPTLRICEKMKCRLLSFPNPDDACCQGDHYNPGDRPFLWAVPYDWPIDMRGVYTSRFMSGWQRNGPRQTEILQKALI